RSATRAADDGRTLHGESGYLRLVGDGAVEMVVAHGFGGVEVAGGLVADPASPASADPHRTGLGVGRGGDVDPAGSMWWGQPSACSRSASAVSRWPSMRWRCGTRRRQPVRPNSRW